MPRGRSNTAKIVEILRAKPGSTMPEIANAIRAKHGPVPPHSVRSAVYAHLGDKGERLFRRESSAQRGISGGRYFLR